ncbi:MAG: hypothetical protein WBD24_02275 [Candidatus Omnitrophota bacterium]
MRMFIVVLTFVLVFCSVPGSLRSQEEKKSTSSKVKYVKSKHGVRALIKLGKSQASMAKEVERQTRNYNKVLEAINDGDLKKGQTASSVQKAVGEPVIILSREGQEVVKWVYKPGNVTFFEDEKVYLMFDKNDELVDWKVLQGKKEPGTEAMKGK